MPDFTTFRFNEDILGRLVIAKRTGTDCLDSNYNKNLKLSSSIIPSERVETFDLWMKTIKEDSKLLELSIREREESQLIMDANMKYHEKWLQTKLNKIDDYV